MRNFYFAVAMAIATFVFVGCEADYGVDSWDTPNTPETSYELVTAHKGSELANNVILDDHQATLVKNNTTIETKDYTAKHELNVTSVTFLRSVAETLKGSTVVFNNGFNLAMAPS